jgi:hypothetical protein
MTCVPMPEGVTRVETGPLQFGDDWPGYFLRGDSALGLSMDALYLEHLVRHPELCSLLAGEITALARRLRSIGEAVKE